MQVADIGSFIIPVLRHWFLIENVGIRSEVWQVYKIIDIIY
ncbi:MAG: hypothetical protein ACR5LA_02990 [Wolbachia sp.]